MWQKYIFIALQFLGTPSNIVKYTSKCVPAKFGAFIRHVPKTFKINANSLHYKSKVALTDNNDDKIYRSIIIADNAHH